MKICVYAISKNEEQFVERFVDSAKEADCVLIGDTGSTDNTVAKIMSLKLPNVIAFRMSIRPWRFDLARNVAMALIPPDMNVCVSLDLDEVLQPGWRQEIERVWKVGETTRLGYMFNWGGPVEFRYEKIHGRDGYKWHHPCHEYPMPYGIEEKWAETSMLMVVHKPDPTKSRAQYLPLLKMSVEEDPHCPRNAFYYARELGFHGRYDEAISEAERYLQLPRAVWDNERCYARRVQGRAWMEKGDFFMAEKCFVQASQEAPNTREPWCELAMVYYKQGRWPDCYAAARRCLSIVELVKVYTVDHDVWGAKPHDLLALAAWNLGMKAEALKHGRIAVELEPDNQRMKDNLTWYEKEPV